VLITNHVLSGALIGALVRRPGPAFAVGVASHFALDAVPHWGDWPNRKRFMQVATRDGLAGLAAIGVLAAVSRPEQRLSVVAGMAGAALPDIDKPAIEWLGRSPWPASVNRFHSAIQDETYDRSRREITTMGVLAAVSLLAVRMPGRAIATRRGRAITSPQAAGTATRPARPGR